MIEEKWKCGDKSVYKVCPHCSELMYYVTREQNGSITMECKKCMKQWSNC